MNLSLGRQLSIQTHLNNLNKISFINKDASSKKRNLYILWYRHIDYLKSIKLRNLHKIMILKTLVFIIKRNNLCKIYAFIKTINKRNHQLIKRKSYILILMFINIYDFLFFSHFNHKYLFKIINTYF